MPATKLNDYSWLQAIRFTIRPMSKLLFRLRNVPDDEAEEVRQLLDDHNIDWFETTPGNWGISMPALWLKDEGQFEQARLLLDDYQERRGQRVREEYQRAKESGQAPTLWQAFLDNPMRVGGYLFMAGLVLYFSLRFFLGFL